MNKERMFEKLEWSIVGWAIWDAMWLPVEMKTKEYIQENYWYITKYIETRKNIFFAKWWFDKPGVWYISDDTLLTLATLDSLAESGKLDFKNLAAKHIEYYDSFPYWFWRSTTGAIEALRNWKTHLETWSPTWTGNWIMMKQAPLAFYYANNKIREEEMNKQIAEYSAMTHANRISVVSAIVHNKLLISLILAEESIDTKTVFWELIEIALQYEKKLVKYESNSENISDKLKELYELINKNSWLDLSDEEILRRFWWWDAKIYKSCYIWVTLPLLYALFLRNPGSKAFFDSINIGWDTDSFGAIMWNMVWAYHGKFYSNDLESWIQDIWNIKAKVQMFIQNILK